MMTRQEQIAELEKDLRALEESADDPKTQALKAQAIYAKVKIHAELEKLRIGEEKAAAGGSMPDEDEAAAMMVDWLKARGKL